MEGLRSRSSLGSYVADGSPSCVILCPRVDNEILVDYTLEDGRVCKVMEGSRYVREPASAQNTFPVCIFEVKSFR